MERPVRVGAGPNEMLQLPRPATRLYHEFCSLGRAGQLSVIVRGQRSS
jgi:hypothetical protein